MEGGGFSEKHKKRISKATMGKNNPFYGRKHSKETREKMSEAWKKRGPVSEETRKKLSKVHKGRIISAETRKKLSLANKGQVPWTKGRKLSEEHKRKISEGHKRRSNLL